MFGWMAWTQPVAIFFICIVLMLVGMTVWEIKSPTTERRGFLPMKTTRGDRLFVGNVVIGAEFQPYYAVNLVAAGCEKQHGHLRAAG